MPTRVEPPRAYITPEVIVWARNRVGLTRAGASKRMGITEERLASWENGFSLPTLRQAESLAQKYYVPYGYFFLSNPPTIELEIPDLRTVPGNPVTSPSPEFEDVVNDALGKQEWFREFRQIQEEAEPLPFVGSFSSSSTISEVALALDETLEIGKTIRPQADSWESFLQSLTAHAERIGVLVFRNGVVGNNTRRPLRVSEFRGFTLSDSVSPVVFLNGNDARSAQIFTLVHELAHIWIAASGVSNPDYAGKASLHPNHVERFCDQVAAEALVPERDFQVAWQLNNTAEANVQRLARSFKVSRMVVLRRAYSLDKVSQDDFRLHYSLYYAVGNARARGGGDFYKNLLSRNSHTFTKALVGSVLNQRTTEREAAMLLNVKVSTFDRFVDWLTESVGA